jgi:methionyl aminopeptidase
MIQLKNKEELDLMHKACLALAEWMEQCIINLAEAGSYSNGLDISSELDAYAKELGPAWDTPFAYQKNCNNEAFSFPVCVSVNDAIVHGTPDEKKFKIGDVITIDAGLSYQGWNADMARTVVFGVGLDMDGVSSDVKRLVRGCYKALNKARTACVIGHALEEISASIQLVANQESLYSIVDYTGHGVGKDLHEEPVITNAPGLLPRYDKVVIRPGMAFCIEPMLTLGTNETIVAPDKWKVWTTDASLAAHFEDEVLIMEEGACFPTVLSTDHYLEEK